MFFDQENILGDGNNHSGLHTFDVIIGWIYTIAWSISFYG